MGKTVLFEGPDISVYQGVVDMKRIRNAGCKRVGLRAGYGKNNVDQRFIPNADACYNLNIPPLIYWFSYALNETMSRNEADFAIAQASKYWKSCPIAFDGEYDTVRYARTQGVNIDKTLMTNMAIAFLLRVKEKGYIPVIYTNRDYLKNYFDMGKITKAVGEVYVWFALYGASKLPANELDITDIWQYTSSGKLDGVTGNVDMNKFYTEFKLDSVKNEEVVKVSNINILNFQKAANADGYRDNNNKPLSEDGMDGPKTQYVRKQILLKVKKVGLWSVTISTGEVVKWVQTRCNEILGTSLEKTGEYDAATRKAVLKLQKHLNLAADGVVGYNTIQALFYN